MANSPPIITWHDALEHCRQWLRGGADEHNEDAFFSATRSALRELTMASEWTSLWKVGNFDLEDNFSTSTITFDFTGGSVERKITLASGTFPANAANFWINIAQINYKVDTRESDTVLTLTPDSNPGKDLASGTAYTLFRSDYTFPADYRKSTEPIHETWFGMDYVQPSEWHWYQRQVSSLSGTPYIYTITGDPSLIGSMAIRLYPAPNKARTLRFMYLRWPRQLKISGLATRDSVGTVTTDGTTTVAGTLTTFAASQVGSIIRFGDADNIPTGFEGRNPPVEERTITARASDTSITVDAAVSTLTTVKYRVSDVVDVDQGLINVYLRCCELNLARFQRDYKVIKIVRDIYMDELQYAMASDYRDATKTVSGQGTSINALRSSVGGSRPFYLDAGIQ